MTTEAEKQRSALEEAWMWAWVTGDRASEQAVKRLRTAFEEALLRAQEASDDHARAT